MAEQNLEFESERKFLRQVCFNPEFPVSGGWEDIKTVLDIRFLLKLSVSLVCFGTSRAGKIHLGRSSRQTAVSKPGGRRPQATGLGQTHLQIKH